MPERRCRCRADRACACTSGRAGSIHCAGPPAGCKLRSRFGCFYELGVHVPGARILSPVVFGVFGVCIRTPDFWRLPFLVVRSKDVDPVQGRW